METRIKVKTAAAGAGGTSQGLLDNCGEPPESPDYNSSDSCGGGGGDSSGSTGPSESDLRAAVMAALRDKAAERGVSVADLDQRIRAEVMSEIKQRLTEQMSERNSQTNSAAPGDPVLATTGRYILEERDIELNGGRFAIGRKYLGEEGSAGSFGQGWLSTLDSRIIRGITWTDEGKIRQMEALVAELAEIWWEYNQIDQRGGEAEAIAGGLYQTIYLPAKEKAESRRMIQRRSGELSALNRYSKYPGMAEGFEHIGNEWLVVIDEGGAPQVFEPAGPGEWLPVSGVERLAMKIRSLDGGGAESTVGFELSVRGGAKKYYDGNGLLVRVEERDGKAVRIERDGEGRAVKVSGPHGDEWEISYNGRNIERIAGPEGQSLEYAYSGGMLSRVRDREGDEVGYVYEEGLLSRIEKADGSAVELSYGYSGAGGKRLVSATEHEEGARERFDYYPGERLTVYTNHSGVESRYWYDGEHRTVREEHADGSWKSYTYNALGLIERENENGSETRYEYDGRGNVREKAYADGSAERWEWNGRDQETRHTDRDGVVTEWEYDGRGNCVEIARGGETVFRGVYNEKNELTISREGNRGAVRYEYDERGYIAARVTETWSGVVTERWEHDALGRVREYRDGAGREWEYEYGAKVTRERTPEGLEREWEYNNRKDLIRIVERDLISGEERETRIVYDKRHLPVEVRDGSGKVVRYEYREDGDLIGKEAGPWEWEYEYDAGGRLSRITRSKAGSNEKYTEEYKYTRESGGFELWEAATGGTQTTGYRSDPWGRVVEVIDALGEKSTRTVSGGGKALREQGAGGV